MHEFRTTPKILRTTLFAGLAFLLPKLQAQDTATIVDTVSDQSGVRWHAQITPLGQAFNTAAAAGIPGINFNQHSGGLPPSPFRA
jgi:hypothetical protein